MTRKSLDYVLTAVVIAVLVGFIESLMGLNGIAAGVGAFVGSMLVLVSYRNNKSGQSSSSSSQSSNF